MPAKRKEKIYWDSNVIIAWIQGVTLDDPHAIDGIVYCVQQVLRNEALIMTSTETDLEVFEGKLTKEQQERYNLVFRSRRCQPVAYNLKVRALAKAIRQHYYLRGEKCPGTEDAKHLASAIHYDADVFYTFDKGKKGGRNLLELDGDVAGHKLHICKPPVGQMRLELGPPQEIKS